jgi:galactose mutarotase-like enzyme
VGGHPAFNLPSKKMDDYFIEFLQPEVMERYLLQDNLFSGETEMLYNYTRYLPLNTGLFDKDAIVFKNLQSTILALKSIKGDYMLQMDFEGFPYLGIWTKPNCQQFICIEPWCGIADRAGYEGEFKNREGINALAPGEVFERSFSIGCM